MLWQPTRGILQPNQHWRRPQTAVAAAPFAVDGQVHGAGFNNSPGSIQSVTLSTTYAGDYIIVITYTSTASPSGVSGSTLGAFSLVSDLPAELSIWAAFASSALSSEVISVTRGAGGDCNIDAFGVSGSNQSSLVWDSGGPQTSTTQPISFTNASANCMLIAGFATQFDGAPAAGSGFTAINGVGANGMISEYQILSSATTTSCATNTIGVVFSGGVIGIPKV